MSSGRSRSNRRPSLLSQGSKILLRMVYESPEPVPNERVITAMMSTFPPGRAHRIGLYAVERQRREGTSSKGHRSRDLSNPEEVVTYGRRRLAMRKVTEAVSKGYIARVRVNGADSLTMGDNPYDLDTLDDR